jgi:AhpD family alkylhydroperoxidase
VSFADGAAPKTRQLIAVAHVTQSPYCIRGHTELAVKHRATEQEVMEAIWVAAEMRIMLKRKEVQAWAKMSAKS